MKNNHTCLACNILLEGPKRRSAHMLTKKHIFNVFLSTNEFQLCPSRFQTFFTIRHRKIFKFTGTKKQIKQIIDCSQNAPYELTYYIDNKKFESLDNLNDKDKYLLIVNKIKRV